jgi:hypothetical protein
MTKLAKINKLEGKVQALVKNLLTVDGHNIAVPIDVKVNGEVGDRIRITYDGRAFLTSSVLLEKAPVVITRVLTGEIEIPPMKEPQNIMEKLKETANQIEIKKFMPDQMYLQYLTTLRKTYSERAETARALMLIPDDVLDEEAYKHLMDLVVAGAIKDAKELMKAAGEKQ